MSQTSAATSSSTSTPHKKKRHEEEGEGKVGFSGVIHRSPPQIPAALLRKIGIKETTSVGKVKVMLKISKADDSLTSAASSASPPFLSVDSRKRQITLLEPGGIGIQNGAPEERRVGVAAPKMFAFDAIFSDEPQSEICTSALSDVIQAVISGSDGCLFCFGHARLGKSYTMVGTPQSSATLGVIPSAISWLFRCISEQKHKTGARFSVRASAIEISSSSQHDQSPGVYLCEEPQLQSELRVPTPEKAAFYLDAALSARTSSECHFLYSLHVYQYSVAGKGGVAGGRSRLHVLDLGSCERVKGQSAMTLSAVGNVLIAIFNGQKHLPHREHRLAQVLKECLGSITCHAAMLAHVSPLPEHYHETLATIQLASRLHRMRRRRVKYVGSTGMNTTNISNCVEDSRGPSSSDVDPSSSEQSADTVIYVGHNRSNHEETDGEHPPVYIPSLTSGDNRAVMSKALPSKPVPKVLPQTKLSNTSKSVPASPQKLSDPSKLMSSPSKSSKALKSSSAKSSPCKVLPSKAQIEEQWIDGPKISKSRIAEARMNIKKEKEMWVDGPKPSKKHDRHEVNHSGYGFLDSHKKNMIRKWVENQTLQVQQKKAGVGQSSSSSSGSGSGSGGSGSGSGSGASGLSSASATYRGLTQFKTCDEDDDMRCLPGEVRGRASGQEDSEEFDDYVMTANPLPLPPKPAALPKGRVVPLDRLQDSSVLHEKLPDNLVPTSQSNVFIRERSDLNINIDKSAIQNSNLNHLHSKETSSTAVYNNISIERVPDDSQTDIEIIEVEIPMEPVPMMDCALQVTEEDILRSMKSPGSVNSNLHEEDLMLKSLGQNPLPEEDQNHNVDLMEHPLKILSQSNLTVVSTFTDSLSVTNDLERLFPHRTTGRAFAMYPWSSSPFQPKEYYANLTKVSSEALSRLDELHRNRYQSRCHSSSFSEADVHSDVDNSSVVSEPAYFPGSDMNKTFCDNCHSSLSCFSKKFMDSRTPHSNMSRHLRNLRHPDGSSNPNLQEDTKEFSRIPGAGAEEDEEMPCPVPPPLHSNLLTLSRDSLISNKRNDNSSLYSNSNERLHDPGGTGSIKSFRNFGFGSGIQYCKNDLETLEQYCKNDFNQSTWRNDRLEQLKREKRALLIELAATKTHLSQSALIKETVTK
ncbi:hypothetical protein M8J76_012662 [Diaphorina citri]|nr:hypothetical protein M8J76_012662 [Diaphorina citri]